MSPDFHKCSINVSVVHTIHYPDMYEMDTCYTYSVTFADRGSILRIWMMQRTTRSWPPR